MVAQYIETRPIMDLCLAAERKSEMRLSRRWWEKLALDILEIRAGYEAAEGGGGVAEFLFGSETWVLTLRLEKTL